MSFDIQGFLQQTLLALGILAIGIYLKKQGVSMRDIHSAVHEVRGLQHELKSQVVSSQQFKSDQASVDQIALQIENVQPIPQTSRQVQILQDNAS